jgi:hypothetical protein
VRATHTHDGRRDTRLDSCIVAARATTSRVGSLPRTCRTLRLHLDDFTHGDCRAGARVSASRDEALALEPPDHEASEHAGSNALHGVAVWRPSTVAEHRELPAREEETANAPGRSEGRCEHLDPAVARRRDGRLDGLPRMREAHGQPRPTSRTLRCSGRRFRTEGVASTRTSRPRPYEGSHVRATHTHDGRRDTRLDSCIVAARATTYVSGLSLGPAGRFACTSTTSRTATAALGRESARLATRLSPWSRRITKRRSTKGRMHCTEWPCGARAPSPSTASCQLVRRRPRMPPAGPRGGASTSTPPSRADAMAASTVCLGCVKPTASPVLRREHSGVPVGGSGPRESRALEPRDHVLTRAATCARLTRTTADATLASTPASSRREPRPTCRVSPSDLPDASPAPRRLHARRLPRWGASQRVSRRGSRLGAAGSRSVGARRVECTARSGRVAPEHRRRAPRAASS